MTAGRPARTPAAHHMVGVSALATECGLAASAMVSALNHLGATAVHNAYDAVASDIADRVRGFCKSGGFDVAQQRFSTLSDAALSRPLEAQELSDLLTLAAAFSSGDPRRLTALLGKAAPARAPQPIFSSQEIPVVEAPIKTDTAPVVVFSSSSDQVSVRPVHTPRSEPVTPSPRAASPEPPAPTPAQRPQFPRRTCNLCREDFWSDAPSHGCAYDLRGKAQAATSALPPVSNVAAKRVRPARQVPIDEDRPRGRSWIVPSGHPGSGRRR